MKKFLKTIIILSLIFSAMLAASLMADAAESGSVDGINWTLDDNGVLTISGERGLSDYNIRDISNYDLVTSIIIEEGIKYIDEFSFSYFPVKSVSIPGSVKYIGWRKFFGCDELEEVNIAEGVQEIEEWAFMGCSALKEITIPVSVKIIGERAFSGCQSLKNVIIEGAKTIGKRAFNGCYALESVILKEGVDSIEERAFYTCESLKSIEIPASVTYIAGNAFSGKMLEEIKVNENNKYYCSVDGNVFTKDKRELVCYATGKKEISWTVPKELEKISLFALERAYNLEKLKVEEGNNSFSADLDGVLYNKDKTVLIKYPNGKKATTYKTLFSVKEIGPCAFSGSRIENITITENVKIIGEYSFSTYSLKEIVIPKNVEIIENDVFWECSQLEKVIIENGVKSIGDYAFGNCRELKEIIIPGSVTHLGEGLFESCQMLQNVELCEGITTLPENVFGDCHFRILVIPKSITTIKYDAFSYVYPEIFYAGSQTDWKKINNEFGNGLSDSTIIHFNSVGSGTFCGMIKDKGIASEFNKQTLQVLIVDENLKETFLDCADDMLLNGQTYADVQELLDSISRQSFGEVKIKFGKVTELNTDSEPNSIYYDAEYDALTGKFDYLTDEENELDIFCFSDGVFEEPYLDDNHTYDIEVYDYAINIINMKAKDESFATAKNITAESWMEADFKYSIEVSCEPEGEYSGMVAMLYDGENLLQRKAEPEKWCVFKGLENASKTYTIEFYLADREEKPLSNIYKKTVSTTQKNILSGWIKETGRKTEFDKQFSQILILDENLKETVYDCEDVVLVNGVFITNIYNKPVIGEYAKFVIEEDEKISIMNTDGDINEQKVNVEYDAKEKCFEGVEKLPVFYFSNGKMYTPILDENHTYYINIYDYAIEITDMCAKEKDFTIKIIECSSDMNSDFKWKIRAYVETDAHEYVVKAKLYDGENLVQESENIGDYIYFAGLDNVEKTYKAKFYIEDEVGNIKSHIYERAIKIISNIIKSGIVNQTGINTEFGTKCLAIQIEDADGNMTVYNCVPNLLLNGNSDHDVYEQDSIIYQNRLRTSVEFALKDGKITVLNIIFELKYNEARDLIVIYSPQYIYQAKLIVTAFENDVLKQTEVIPLEIVEGTNWQDNPITDCAEVDTLKLFLWSGEGNSISPLIKECVVNLK